jgi:nicotinate-nucleotide pyrophosphorylase (carboxylating)
MDISVEQIRQQVTLALQEDVGSGDVTARLLDPNKIVQARLITREDAILCGTRWFDEVFHQLDEKIQIDWQTSDGQNIQANQTLCQLTGPAHSILTGERVALNFLQTLSGTATLTHSYVKAIGKHRAKLLDTRKTIPGLRLAQKYAVTCGGGHNHRIGLYDMILIKENHIAACGSIQAAITEAKKRFADLAQEVEVESLAQLEEALAAGAKRILLDNFENSTMKEAVKLANGRASLEASGNITLENINTVAATGVDYISTGAITKHLRAIDLSLRITG